MRRAVERAFGRIRPWFALVRSPWVRGGFLLLAVTLAVVALVAERDAVVEAVRRLSPGLLGAAALATLANVTLALIAWRVLLADLGAALPPRSAARVYLVGQVGKYVPGGVWNVLAAAELGSDHGIARRRTVSSMLVAVLVSANTAALLVLLSAPALRGVVPGPVGLLVALAPLPLLLLHPAVLNGLVGLLLRVTGRDPLSGALCGRGIAVAAGWTVLSWLAVGVQVGLLAVAVGAPPTVGTFVLATAGYAAAWIVGTAVVVVPAGAGARELALVLALAPVLEPGGALVVALLSRALLTATDLVLAGAALAATRKRTGAASGP